MKIAAVLWKDRHADPTIHLFTDPAKAIEWAREKAKEFDRHGDFKEIELTAGMKKAGWIYAVDYSCEGDGLRVEMLTIDKDAQKAPGGTDG